MDQVVFDKLRSLIYDTSGISLSLEKKPLLETRVGKRLRALKLDDEETYLAMLLADHTGEELINLLDVVSTNVTYFWRESEHFDFLISLFQRWREERKPRVRIWCAAASSGEEPYTISMLANEYLDLTRCDFRLLATDISITILRQALRGTYPQKQIDQLPAPLLNKYFHSVILNDEPRFAINDEVKSPVLFKRLNLSEFPYPLKGDFDLIFCRNVMIYFDNILKQRIINEFDRLITPGGHLIISKTESLINIHSEFRSLGTSIYQRRGLPS